MISVVVISKDEPALDDTLRAVAEQSRDVDEATEIVVVDASKGRLDDIRERHPDVVWIDFERPPGVRVSIPHQRNRGVRTARGQTVVFTDAGCYPRAGWLANLVAPILSGDEEVVTGSTVAFGEERGLYDSQKDKMERNPYVDEAPTINLAFARAAFDAVGGFDERFEYGSDIDFTWRLIDAGRRIRTAPDALVEHEWGDPRRQFRRSWLYGQARARLYLKHRNRVGKALRHDPIVFVYPLFLLGLPLTARFRLYPLLLLIPAWRNRSEGPARVLADHLLFGAGALREVTHALTRGPGG